jgi:DNA-binding response OmpR family regulator
VASIFSSQHAPLLHEFSRNHNRRKTRIPTPLIVTSRLADEKLWAEALNLGAYDVLAKPFDLSELVRSVNLAWLHWWHQQSASLAYISEARALTSS